MTKNESLDNIELSIIIPVFIENDLNVKPVQERIESFKILAELYGGSEVIIVDDGSCSKMIDWYIKICPDMEKSQGSLRIFTLPRAGDWTQPRARNIGMQLARGRKFLLTDIDHLIPPLTFGAILKMDVKIDEGILFRRRLLRENLEIDPHPCTVLFKGVQRYFHEQFCGGYGSDDTYWWEYWDLRKVTSSYIMMAEGATQHHNLNRDTSRNKKLLLQLRRNQEEPNVTKLEEVYEKDSSIGDHQ